MPPVWLYLWRSGAGYSLRAVGFSPEAARYAGIAPRMQIMRSMMLSGALAALVAMNELAGVQGRLLAEFVAGAGFAGMYMLHRLRDDLGPCTELLDVGWRTGWWWRSLARRKGRPGRRSSTASSPWSSPSRPSGWIDACSRQAGACG